MLTLIAILILSFLTVWLWPKISFKCPASLAFLLERDNPFFSVHRTKSIIKNSHLKEAMTVLDAGCGPGRLTIPIAKKIGSSGKLIALDIDPKMLQIVEEKIKSEKINNVAFINARLDSFSLPEETFDLVFLVTVIGELDDPQKALSSIHKALKANGILSITEVISDPHFVRKIKLLNLLHTSGFKELEIFGNSLAYTINFQKIKFI